MLLRIKTERGITAELLGKHFLDVAAFPQASLAAERVWEGMKQDEKIGVFGDYDCDGITSTAQLVRFFRRHGTEPVVRLPHRVHDGYGLKPASVDAFHAAGVTLLVTVDTGISALDAMEHAKKLGIDVIILDHHHVPATLPPAFAILHPKLAGLPEPHPAAAGVTFAFLHALEGESWKDRETDLALAMFGTIADLVPLRGANRLLVQQGLGVLSRLKEGPVAVLLDQIRSEGKPLTSIDIAFRIAPRLNAAGRMADPTLALHALLEGGSALTELEELNTLRQVETRTQWAEVLKNLLTTPHLPPFLSIANAAYQPGIVGLLAGKLTEHFGRPSMAVHINGDTCSASLRSPSCYNIVEALTRHANLFLSFGGHAQAAGCTFTLKALPIIEEALRKDTAANTDAEELHPTLTIDGILEAHHLSLPLCHHLETLGPFGQGNAEPLFLLQNTVLEQVRTVGTEGAHLQAKVGNAKVIGFHMGHFAEQTKEPLDLAVRMTRDSWNGRESVQLQVVDLREAQTVKTMARQSGVVPAY